jgi:hypothetical protein
MPRELRYGPKNGVFPPRLRDIAPGSSALWQGAWQKMRKNATAYPVQGVGDCPHRGCGYAVACLVSRHGTPPLPPYAKPPVSHPQSGCAFR